MDSEEEEDMDVDFEIDTTQRPTSSENTQQERHLSDPLADTGLTVEERRNVSLLCAVLGVNPTEVQVRHFDDDPEAEPDLEVRARTFPPSSTSQLVKLLVGNAEFIISCMADMFEREGRSSSFEERLRHSSNFLSDILGGLSESTILPDFSSIVTSNVMPVFHLWLSSMGAKMFMRNSDQRQLMAQTTDLVFGSRFKEIDSRLNFDWALECRSAGEVESRLFLDDVCEVAMIEHIGALDRYKRLKGRKAQMIFECLGRMVIYASFLRSWLRRSRSVTRSDDPQGREMAAEKMMAELELFWPLRGEEDYMGVLRANGLRVMKEIELRVIGEVGGPEVPMGRGGGERSRFLAIEAPPATETARRPIKSVNRKQPKKVSEVVPAKDDLEKRTSRLKIEATSAVGAQAVETKVDASFGAKVEIVGIGVFMPNDRFLIQVDKKLADFPVEVSVKTVDAAAKQTVRTIFKLEDLLDSQNPAQVHQEILLAPGTSTRVYNEELLALHFSNAIRAMKLSEKVLTPGDQLIAMALQTQVNSIGRQRLKTSLSLIGLEHTLFVQVSTALAVSAAAEVPAAGGRKLLVVFIERQVVEVTVFEILDNGKCIALATGNRKHEANFNSSSSAPKSIVPTVLKLVQSVLDGSAVNSGVVNIDKPLVTSATGSVSVDPAAQLIFEDLKATFKKRFANLHLVLKHRKSILDGLARISAEGAEYNRSRLYQELCPWTLVADFGSEHIKTVVKSNQLVDQVITLQVPLGDLKSDQLAVYRDDEGQDKVPEITASKISKCKLWAPTPDAYIQVAFDPQGLVDLRPCEEWQGLLKLHRNCMPNDAALREEALGRIAALLPNPTVFSHS